MRNIEGLRQQGVRVSGSWFNRHVLMFKETLQSQLARAPSTQHLKDGSAARPNHLSDEESLLNIELGDLAVENLQSQIDSLNQSYVTKRAKKTDLVVAKYKKVGPKTRAHCEEPARSRSVKRVSGRGYTGSPRSANTGVKRKYASRGTSAKKVIRGKPGGFEVVQESHSVQNDYGRGSDLRTGPNKDLTPEHSSKANLDQDITP
jgi:hypothetical protein